MSYDKDLDLVSIQNRSIKWNEIDSIDRFITAKKVKKIILHNVSFTSFPIYRKLLYKWIFDNHHLKIVSICYCTCGDMYSRILMACLGSTSIITLRFKNDICQNLDSDIVRLMATNSHLKNFHLSFDNMDPDSFAVILEGLRLNCSIETFSLTNTDININDHINTVSTTILQDFIPITIIRYPEISRLLQKLLTQKSQLKSLMLDALTFDKRSQLSTTNWKKWFQKAFCVRRIETPLRNIAQTLGFNQNLKSLSLSHKVFDLSCIEALMLELQFNTTLEILRLTNSGIKDKACRRIFEMLRHNATLQELILDDNPITVEGMALIIASLEFNQSLEMLSVENHPSQRLNCQISIYLPLMCNSSLKQLIISPHVINDQSCQELGLVLKHNQCLEYISFDNLQLSEVEATIIQEALGYNSSCRMLKLQRISLASAKILKDAFKFNQSLIRLEVELCNQDLNYFLIEVIHYTQCLQTLVIEGMHPACIVMSAFMYNQSINLLKIYVLSHQSINTQVLRCSDFGCRRCINSYSEHIRNVLEYNQTLCTIHVNHPFLLTTTIKSQLRINQARRWQLNLRLVMIAAKIFVKTHNKLPSAEIVPEEVIQMLRSAKVSY